MIPWLIAVFVMIFVIPLLSDDSNKITYTVQFSQEDLSFDKLQGYDIVKLRDADFLTEPGKPKMPSKGFKIALPLGMAVKSVYVTETKTEEISGEYNIFPSQPPIKIGSSDSDADFVEPEKEIYTSSQPYPSKLVEFVHQTDLAGQGIGVFQLYPLQYVPSEKRLTLYTSITFIIEGVSGYQCGDYLSPNISERGKETYQQMIQEMVKNPEEVQLNTALKMSTSMVPPGGPFAHVIITSTTYASSFQPLVDWHIQKGVNDTVITTTWIYSTYSGTTNQQKIRNFIIDANSSWGTTYFLLAGENETIPFEYKTYYSESAPSDQYYSDFDDDWTHEVFVGRASVGSTTEATTFVNKVLKYEKNPPRTSYPLDVLLIGMDLDASTRCELLKENIDTYIPSQFTLTKVYDSHTTNHRTATISALNAGQNLVNHADHSYIDVMGTGDFHHGWGIYNSDVDALTNDNQLSIIVSCGCDPNRMDANDCIAEHFVLYNPNQAGVAFNGNTRSGWYFAGDPYSLSNALDKQWWVGLFSRNKYNLGQTIIDSKHNFDHSDVYEKQCEWTFNLLGEPEMPIWTDAPDSFDVTHPSTIPPGTSSFLVHVEDATTHAAVNLAYVCLWKANDVYLTGYTNTSGDVTFNPSPSTEGTVYVTVTKHNYIPHQDQVEVSGHVAGDANGDWIIDIADVMYLINYLYKGGPPPNPLEAGDANCDGFIDSGDVIYLINYLFVGGPIPDCP